MAIYNLKGQNLMSIKHLDSYRLSAAFKMNAKVSFIAPTEIGQQYLGGYIEIQPDSWDGVTPVSGAQVPASDSTAWGFPMSLSTASKNIIKSDMLNGTTGIKYIRFPLGFAYRGYRNIDPDTNLAKNIGERWPGQNSELQAWFSDIVAAGGGLAPQYWCPAPYWLTSGNYVGSRNQLTAGGSYSRETTLASIRESDPLQYDQQVDDFTNAVIDDLQYLQTNIAPIVMFGLANEPANDSLIYGSCSWDGNVYKDVLYALCQKFQTSFPNIKVHAASSDETNPFSGIAGPFIEDYGNLLWGFSHHSMRLASGEEGTGALDYYQSDRFKNMVGNKNNVFLNEYEYFSTVSKPDEFRCANNMIHLIEEMVQGGAQVLHPIIHICKPTGQSASSTNTTGYCLYQVDMSDGSVTTNTWAYNSWKMFSDNLPIGSQLLKNFYIRQKNIAVMGVIYNQKYRFFIANIGTKSNDVNIYLQQSKNFSAQLYNLQDLGGALADVTGTHLKVTVPSFSGICLIEKE